jgi:hypothetical protein
MGRCKVPKGTIVDVRGYNANGCPVRQPLSDVVTGGGGTPETPLTVTDTATLDLVAGSAGNGHTSLSSSFTISPKHRRYA